MSDSVGAQGDRSMEAAAEQRPAARGAPAPHTGRSGRTLDDLFRPGATVPPARVSAGYAIATGGAFVTLVLVIASYLALIGLIGWAVYWHATEDVWMLKPSGVGGMAASRGRGYILQLLAYLTPIVTGIVVVVFMLKPLFARRSSESWPVPLDRKDQPAVFAAVERIALLLGSPTPKAIEVDCNANASARLDGGGLVLRIGLPLAQGLDLRELLGVIAHELGHFRQGVGMRLTWSVRRLIAWLLDAVYRRDQLDEWLEETARADTIWIVLPAQFARLCVWVSRRVLWLLAHVAMLVVSSLLRQMEYDADRAEVGIAGVKAFVSTSQALSVLGAADGAARRRVIENLKHQQLPDNLSALAMEERQRFDERVVERIRSASHAAKTGLFDSHPSPSDRVAAARAVGGEGVIALDAPGTALFRHFEGLAKVATIAEYRERLGPLVDEMTLVPVKGVVAAAKADDTALKSVERYFGMPLHPRRPLPFGDSHPRPVSDLPAAVDRLASLRHEHLAAARAVKPYAEEFHAAMIRVRNATIAERLVNAGLPVPSKDLGVEGSSQAIAERKRQGEAAIDAVLEHLERNERLGVERLQLALRLLLHPEIQSRLTHQWKQDVGRLTAALQLYAPALASIHGAHAALLRAADEWSVLVTMLQGLSGTASEKQVKAILASSRELRRRLVALHEVVREIPSPFPHGGPTASSGGATLADVALPQVPADSDPGELADACHGAMTTLDSLRDKVAGRLIHLATKVEVALELAPRSELGAGGPTANSQPGRGDSGGPESAA